METTYNFIERTRKIIRQYDKFQLPPKDNFDVTLLLNCCVGLLFVTKEKENDSFLKSNKTSLSEWSIDETTITTIKNRELNTEKKTLFNVCKHIRNSIAHCHFKVYASGGKGKMLDRIEFKDYLREEVPNKLTFEYTTSVAEFRTFLDKLSKEANEHIQF